MVCLYVVAVQLKTLRYLLQWTRVVSEMLRANCMVPNGTNEIKYNAERTPPVIMQNPVWIQMVRFRYPDGMAVESMYYYSMTRLTLLLELSKTIRYLLTNITNILNSRIGTYTRIRLWFFTGITRRFLWCTTAQHMNPEVLFFGQRWTYSDPTKLYKNDTLE